MGWQGCDSLCVPYFYDQRLACKGTVGSQPWLWNMGSYAFQVTARCQPTKDLNVQALELGVS